MFCTVSAISEKMDSHERFGDKYTNRACTLNLHEKL